MFLYLHVWDKAIFDIAVNMYLKQALLSLKELIENVIIIWTANISCKCIFS